MNTNNYLFLIILFVINYILSMFMKYRSMSLNVSIIIVHVVFINKLFIYRRVFICNGIQEIHYDMLCPNSRVASQASSISCISSGRLFTVRVKNTLCTSMNSLIICFNISVYILRIQIINISQP